MLALQIVPLLALATLVTASSPSSPQKLKVVKVISQKQVAQKVPIVAAHPNKVNNIKISLPKSPGQKESYKHADGTFNKAFVAAERIKIRKKYAANTANLKSHSLKKLVKPKKRGTGSINLSDNIYKGTDVEYYGNVGFGTPSQILSMDFDTGSSDVWIPVVKLAGSPGYFNTKASSTYKSSSKSFKIDYGIGGVSGFQGSDTLNLGGFVVPKQTIGTVLVESADYSGDPASGVFGMGFSSISTTGMPTPLENLLAAGRLTSKLFAFHYTRNAVTGSLLSIGAINKSHFSGTLVYTPVISRTYWEVKMTSVQVNKATITKSSCLVAIDTGTSNIYLPTAITAAIYKSIPGSSAKPDGSGEYTYPCASTAIISLSFAGIARSFSINSLDFSLGRIAVGSSKCTGAIMASDMMDFNNNYFGILGDSFIKNWYTVFSYDANNGAPAVGFALNR